jgi:hypothetical protein
MEAMGTIGGGAIVVKKYQAGFTVANAGIPLLGGGTAAALATGASVQTPTTTTALTTGMVGLGLDTTGTVAATGVSDNNDIIVSVAVNPDLIIRCRMNHGATEDTSLPIQTTTAADAAGATATGITSLTQGMIWGYDGNQKGVMRRTDNTAGSVVINFDDTTGIASGDRFLYANSAPAVSAAAGLANGPDLTTLFTQGDATTANPGDNDTFMVIDVELGTEDDVGEDNSYWHFVQNQNIFGNTQTTA